MKKIFTFTITSTIFLLIGCKYTCPAFDMSDKLIISQRLNDTLLYVSNLSDTMTLIVEKFEANRESTHSKGPLVADVECCEKASYSTNLSKSSQIQISELYDFCNNHTVTFCRDDEYNLWGSNSSQNYLVERYNDVEIDGVVYYMVYKGYDKSENRRIDSFIKASNTGIIEFHDKQTGLTWKLSGKRN